MTALKIILVVFVVCWILAFVFSRLYRSERRPDVIYYVPTTDGWKIALSRFFPNKEKSDDKKLPVVLCHGLSGNSNAFNFSERISLARTLAAEGYEVFAIDYRGAGWTGYPKLNSGLSRKWIFDDYLDKDIPAGIDKALELTGASQVHYVGHSMGGMLLYALLQGPHKDKIATAATLASPGAIDEYKPVAALSKVITLIPTIHIGWLSKLTAPLAEMLPVIQKMVGNVELERGHTARAHVNTVDNVPSALLAQFAKWASEGRFLLADGRDVSSNRAEINTPLMFVVGTSDLTVSPASVKRVFDEIGSERKEFHFMGKEHGHQSRYGHNSVVFGKTADREVYPLIIEWLSKYTA